MATTFEQPSIQAAEDAKELGNMSYELGELEEALSCYLEATSLDPDNAVYYSNTAAVYFEQRRWKECRDICARAIEVALAHPHRCKEDTLAKMYSRHGYALARLEDYSGAVASLSQALKRKDDPEWRSEIRESLDKLQKAQTDSNPANVKTGLRKLAGVTAIPKNIDLSQSTITKVLEACEYGDEKFKEDKFDDAIAAYVQAEQLTGVKDPVEPLFPEHHMLYAMRAMAFLRANRLGECLSDCDVCIRLDPLFTDIHLLRANVHGLQDRYREAVEGLIQAERLGASKAVILERLQTMLISLILQEKRLSGKALDELKRTQLECRVSLDNRGNRPHSDLPRVDGQVIPRRGDFATSLIDDEKLAPFLGLIQEGLSLPQVIMLVKAEQLRELIIISQLYLTGLFKDIGMDFDDNELQSEFEDSRKRRTLAQTNFAKQDQSPSGRKDESKPEKKDAEASDQQNRKSVVSEDEEREQKDNPKDPLDDFDAAVLETASLPVIDKQGGGKTDRYSWSQTPADVTIQFEPAWVSTVLPSGSKLTGKEVEVKFGMEQLEVEACGVVLLTGKFPFVVQPDECLWTLDDNVLEVILQKSLPGVWWQSVLTTEPKIDTSPVLAEEQRMSRRLQQHEKQQRDAQKYSHAALMKGWQKATSIEDFETHLPDQTVAKKTPKSEIESFGEDVARARRYLQRSEK